VTAEQVNVDLSALNLVNVDDPFETIATLALQTQAIVDFSMSVHDDDNYYVDDYYVN